MSKIVIDDVSTQFGFKTAINDKLKQIQDEFNDKVLYRSPPSGEPNAMASDLDMGGHDILNVKALRVNDIGVVGESSFKELIEEAKQAVEDCEAQTTLSTLQANASAYSAGLSAASASEAAISASNAAISEANTSNTLVSALKKENNLSDLSNLSIAHTNFGASSTASANKIPIADSNGKLDSWVSWSSKANTDLSNVTSIPQSLMAASLNATGSAPFYACRAWVNFNGTGTVEMRANGNISSIADNGVGDYSVNFTVAMPNANYAIVGTSGGAALTTIGSVYLADNAYVRTTTTFRINTFTPAGGVVDAPQINLAIFV